MPTVLIPKVPDPVPLNKPPLAILEISAPIPPYVGAMAVPCQVPDSIVPIDTIPEEFKFNVLEQSKSIVLVFVVVMPLLSEIAIIVSPFSFKFIPVFPSNVNEFVEVTFPKLPDAAVKL